MASGNSRTMKRQTRRSCLSFRRVQQRRGGGMTDWAGELLVDGRWYYAQEQQQGGMGRTAKVGRHQGDQWRRGHGPHTPSVVQIRLSWPTADEPQPRADPHTGEVWWGMAAAAVRHIRRVSGRQPGGAGERHRPLSGTFPGMELSWSSVSVSYCRCCCRCCMMQAAAVSPPAGMMRHPARCTFPG